MAKIIELVGSPGSGKSTIYKQLISKWKNSSVWIPADKVYPRQQISYQKSINFFITTIKRLLLREDLDAMAMAGERFISLYPDYMDLCWNTISREKNCFNGTDQRLQKASWVFNIIQRIQTLTENEETKIVIVDEGLVNSIGWNTPFITQTDISSVTLNTYDYKNLLSAEEKKEIDLAIKYMPLPHGLVSIEINIDINIDRLMSRSKQLPSFKNLSKEELKKIFTFLKARRDYANDFLLKEGIPILYLNTSDTVEVCCEKIISFTKALEGKINDISF